MKKKMHDRMSVGTEKGATVKNPKNDKAALNKSSPLGGKKIPNIHRQ